VSDEKDTTEKAKELLVYGPIGLALFLRDTAPQFLRMFVARGRSEVEERRRAVGDQIGQVRAAGETAAVDGAPEVMRIVTTGLANLRERAEEALNALGVFNDADDEPRHEEPVDDELPGSVANESESPSAFLTMSPAGDLAIPDYDDLSASQVVDRLEGLGRPELAAIRDYERSHRARNTILGKIEQLTHRS
jgi:hypothetical protein